MPTSRPILLDNTVLTNFALINRADLILDLWGTRCATTTAVIKEYQAGVASRGLPAKFWDKLAVLTPQPLEETTETGLSPILGKGERSCIAIGVHRQALFVSDDANARREARRLGLTVSGTIGILILNIRRGNLTLADGNVFLTNMVAHGYRTPVLTLNDLV